MQALCHVTYNFLSEKKVKFSLRSLILDLAMRLALANGMRWK